MYLKPAFDKLAPYLPAEDVEVSASFFFSCLCHTRICLFFFYEPLSRVFIFFFFFFFQCIFNYHIFLPQSNFVLLADAKLQALPLELLPALGRKGIQSVTRDFSLSCLLHRMDGMNMVTPSEGTALRSAKSKAKDGRGGGGGVGGGGVAIAAMWPLVPVENAKFTVLVDGKNVVPGV